MKKIFLLSCLLICMVIANAQIKGLVDRMKQRAKDKSNQKINTTGDNIVDSAFSKTERTVKETVKDATTKDTTEKKSSPGNYTTPDNNTYNVSVNDNSNNPASFKAYSKYDFVPGEKIIGFDDFSTGNVGDFPAGWNTTASGEIVTIEGKPGRWLWITTRGEFAPEFPQPFPEDFTLEFDLMHGIPIDGAGFLVCIAELANLKQPQYWSTAPNQFTIELNNANTGTENGITRFIARINSSTDIQNVADATNLNDKNNPAHISIWRQKERVRVYVNEVKIWDIPKATVKEAKFNSIVFSVTYAEEVVKHYIGNLRLAVGAPDATKKMLEQNKWVTHGILFDVNSANIKPESYGTLKEIASVLKEFPDLRVKIVGHTDSDGNDDSNLNLSKQRATSVKSALMSDFGIDGARMETDGKGESEQIDKNDIPAGKANNRRVEFIKLY